MSRGLVTKSGVLVGAIFCTISGCSGNGENTASTSAEAMSTTIYSVYGVTSFGGPGDCQSFACGGYSCSSQPWYSASSQRYGCGVHLQVVSNTTGKCVVVVTADAGPASWVESDAGIPILDAGPQVGQYLFGNSSLGWSTRRWLG